MHHDVNQWRSTSVQRWRSCVTRLAGPDYSRSPLYRNPSNLLKDPLSATDVVTLNSLIPQLLTFRLGIIGVIAVIPDPFWKRIPRHRFRNPLVIEAEYCRILGIRDLLRIEEIIADIQIEHSVCFWLRRTSRQTLTDLRALIGRACKILQCIEEHSHELGLRLDFAEIREKHRASLPPFHPYTVLKKCELFHASGLGDFEEFRDYSTYDDSQFSDSDDEDGDDVYDVFQWTHIDLPVRADELLDDSSTSS